MPTRRPAASLAAHGLDAVIDFGIAERVKLAQVPQVIERALLQEWADYQLRTDPALAPLRAVGRDALVSGYQQLDGALTAAAAEDIINACNARRPRSDTGESAVIHRAAATNKHMPVRELLEQSRHLTQVIKPCFLMSPLAVSQYLPAGMRFDAVIFDEASQISPADAINCIYRGGALILAGDPKQLPPAGVGGAARGGQRRGGRGAARGTRRHPCDRMAETAIAPAPRGRGPTAAARPDRDADSAARGRNCPAVNSVALPSRLVAGIPSLAFATPVTWEEAMSPVVLPSAATDRHVAGQLPLAAACAGIAGHYLHGQ